MPAQLHGASPLPAASLLRAILLRLWLALVLAASILFLWFAVVPALTPAAGSNLANGLPLGKDFVLFYAAGRLADAGRGAEAYDDPVIAAAENEAAGTPIPSLYWPYPPAMLLVTGAVAALPYRLAFALWLALGAAALGLVAWRLAPHPATPVLALLSPSVAYCGMMGHAGLYAAAVAGAGFLALPRRPLLAGALLSLLTLKFQLVALLVVALVAAGERRALASLGACAVMLHLLGLLVFGPAAAAGFLHEASGVLGRTTETAEFLARVPTAFSAAASADLGSSAALLVQAAATMLACAAVAIVWRRTRDLAARAFAWAAGVPLSVPYLVDYDLAIFAVPLAAIGWRCWQGRVGWREAAAMTMLWSAAPAVFPLAQWAGFQAAPLAAAALLLLAVIDRTSA